MDDVELNPVIPDPWLAFGCNTLPIITNYQWKDVCMTDPEEYRCQMYSKYHSDVWYPLLEEMSEDDKYFTMKSFFLPYNIDLMESQNIPYNPYFVRLNSVSPKYREPIYTVKDAYKVIMESERTRNTLLCNYDHKIMFREYWKDIKDCKEYRLVIIKDKLCHIENYFSGTIDIDKTVINMIKSFYENLMMDSFTPYENYVMDVVHIPNRIENSIYEDGLFIVEINDPWMTRLGHPMSYVYN